MKYLFFVCCTLHFALAFSQNDKTAIYYYEMGLEKERDPQLKRQNKNFEECLPYFLKASNLADEGSELQLKAIYKTVYLYNYAKVEQKQSITQKTIKGLRYLRKLKRKDSFASDYFFRAGLAFLRDYRPDSAIYTFGEAKNIYEQLGSDYAVKVSDCYHGIGDVYKDALYDFNSAESFYEKAIAVREKAGQDELNLFLVSKLYFELASVNKSQHEFEKALAYSLKNVVFAQTLPAAAYKFLEDAYTNTADIYSEMGESGKAVELYLKAIATSKKNNRNKIKEELGNYYCGLADVYKKVNRNNQAIEYYRKAIATFDFASIPKNVLFIKSCQRLSECYLINGELNNSRFYFRKGIKLLNDFGLQKSGQASELYRFIGNFYEKEKKPDSALAYYQLSLIAASNKFKPKKIEDNPSHKEILLADFAYEALLAKSKILVNLYVKENNIYFANTALSSLGLAEKLLIDSRSSLDMDNSKWVFFDSNYGLYEQVLSLLHRMQKYHPNDTLQIYKAFYYMESSKSKMLADALNEAEFAKPLLSSDSLIQFLDLQRRNLYQLQDELKKWEGNDFEQKKIGNSIIETDRKIQLSENEIALKYPSYIKTKYRHEIPSLPQIQNFLKERKTTVIEYFWGIDEVFGLLIQENQTVFEKLGKTNEILPLINGVHELLSSDQYPYNSESVNFFENKSYLIYQRLVAPFEKLLKNDSRIVILPDGPIEQIPFEVLVTKPLNYSSTNFATLNYVLKNYFLSYSFSSSYLLNQNGQKLSSPKMLAFGFTEGNGSRSGGTLKNQSKLPGSEVELRRISREFPRGEYYFGKDVTEQAFKERAPHFDLLHLAVHGMGNTEQNYSASLFFKDTITSKDDGRLYWYELFGLRLKAKLAVISSCESGIGKTYRGEGMLSMASAFAFAGCKNIVMGLWKVDDHVSAELMGELYKNLKHGDYVDVALTKAKRLYIENGDDLTAHPRLWASLVSYGNEEVIEKDDNRIIYLILFIGLPLIALYFFLKKKRSSSHKIISPF